jgi:hypothetical protein
MLRRTKSMRGYHLGAIDGEIGHVKEFYFDDVTWKIRYLVADTGKWLSHRKVLISPHAFGTVDSSERIIHVQLTREQVEHSPSIDADKPVSRQFEEEYFRYFGWPFYWVDPLLWGSPSMTPIAAEPEDATEEKHDTHLRSMEEVTGYHIQARDREIGHVEDFLVDDSDWGIRDMIVDTRNWLPGKRVLIAPEFIKRVSWEEAKVFVLLDSDSVKEQPEYHPDEDEIHDSALRAYAHEPMMMP